MIKFFEEDQRERIKEAQNHVTDINKDRTLSWTAELIQAFAALDDNMKRRVFGSTMTSIIIIIIIIVHILLNKGAKIRSRPSALNIAHKINKPSTSAVAHGKQGRNHHRRRKRLSGNVNFA